jgi:hypothetical protein
MLFLLLVTTAFSAEFLATPSFPIASVIRSTLYNGTYTCPIGTVCRSSSESCQAESVCCSQSQDYVNGTCLDKTQLYTCGAEGTCCTGYGNSCQATNVCCPSASSFCSSSGVDTVCVEMPKPYPEPYPPCSGVGCGDGGYYYGYNQQASAFIAAASTIFAVLTLLSFLVIINSSIQVYKIFRIQKRFTPTAIEQVTRMYPDFFKPNVREIIKSPGFLDDLQLVYNHYSYTRFYQILVFGSSLGYFIEQLIKGSFTYGNTAYFATTSFVIMVHVLLAWAVLAIYIRYKFADHFEAIPALLRARHQLFKYIVIEPAPAYPMPREEAVKADLMSLNTL